MSEGSVLALFDFDKTLVSRDSFRLLGDLGARSALERGKLFGDAVVAKLGGMTNERYKERVLFHALLYVGIFDELHGREKEALKHLDAAASNKFGRSTGTYMWQVARVHHDLLAKKLSPKGAEKDSPAEKPKD